MDSPKPKRKPSKRKSASEKPQSERFKETARKLEAKSREAFERTFSTIAPPRHKRRKSEAKAPAK